MPARFQRIEQIFLAALDKEPDQITAFLNMACDGDEALRREVEELLASDQRASRFIEKSAVGLVTKVIHNQQAHSLIGETIDHYKISESIGAGGMGEVYLATDIVARRKAALKLLPLQFTGDAERLKRFEQEAHAVVALNHPNILTVYEIGEDHSIHYIASELIEGETLRDHLRRGPMPLSETVDVAIQVASALAAAHDGGIVHRDIKPENIMLRPDGYVKVLDFGIAKLAESAFAKATADGAESMTLAATNLGSILGTVRYMSPEQACGAPVDERTDIWSLGIVLYEMVTGHAPFTGDTPKEVISAILEKEPSPVTRYLAHAPAELQQIISKTLRKDRDERYHSAHELLGALKSLRHKLEVDAEFEHTNAARSWRRRGARAAVVLGLLLAALAVGLPFYRSWNLTTTLLPEKSIAVLPFENATSDPTAEYVSDGISEALINSLTELPQLRVIARSTAFHYKGTHHDLRQIARELRVETLLTGKVRQRQDSLNVQVDLVDATTGSQLWGANYERKISDVIAVKQAIAEEVTEKLKLRLSGEDRHRLVKRDTTNPEAYQFYLRGRYFWNKRSSDGIKQAIYQFEQSIARDPNFALGHVGLADSYIALTFYGFATPDQTMANARRLATKALALDNTLAEAHVSLAHVLMNYDWDWSAAEKEFKRSIELNPGYATAHQWYAIHYLTATGRLEEAVREMKKALELEPASLVMNAFMGGTLYYAGRYDEAIDQCHRTLEMDPTFSVAHWYLGLAYEQEQFFDLAIEEFQKAISSSGGGPLMKAALGHAYAKAQRNREANIVLAELDELSKRQYVSPYELAAIHVALGNDERVFELLEQAYRDHSFHLVYLNIWPQFGRLRSDPRFQNLVQRIGLSRSATPSLPPLPREKSIAVLPFENLSKDEENAFFAGGVQDEILTDLAKVADLKVISRTSVMKYKSDLARNLREIANTLGVSHVVEGSVQRAGGRVRVNVQLIDARNDTHIWAEHYDRDFAAIFAIQSEIAERIVDQLRAKLSASEKAAITERPTADLVAYTYYTKAKEMNIYENWEGAEKPAAQRVELLEKATQRDPNFALAYCELAKAEIELGDLSGEGLESGKHLELGKKAAETALRLRPDLPEPHLALARYDWYEASRVGLEEMIAYYNRARDELAIVRQKLPNNPQALLLGAMVGRHQNRWDASLADLQKASELDPRNTEIAHSLWQIYFEMRRYSDCERLTIKQAASSKPEDPGIKKKLADIKLAQGDPVAAQALLEQIPLDWNPSPYIWLTRFKAALYLRNYGAAVQVIGMTPAKGAADLALFDGPPEWAYGQVARARGDKQAALAAFQTARNKEDALSKVNSENPSYVSGVARYDAGLGRKEDAIREARRAIEIMPTGVESLNGPTWVGNLALVYAWTGERDAALEQLEKIATLPGYTPTYGDLLLNPCWDDLRGDPRFDKIVAATKAASR